MGPSTQAPSVEQESAQPRGLEPAAWFVSANPEIYRWDQAFRAGNVEWTGARSTLAQSNIRRCRNGDRIIAYQSSPEKLVVGLGHVDGEPIEFKEGGKRWMKVRIVMEPPPFARPIPLAQIRELCPQMSHFHVVQPSFTWVSGEEWVRLQPAFADARRAEAGAGPVERTRPPRTKKSPSPIVAEPPGEMIITTLGSDDFEAWRRLKNQQEVVWRFGPPAKTGDNVLVYVPKGLTDQLTNETPGLRFLFKVAKDSHAPTSQSRWRQEATLIDRQELKEPVSMSELRADPVAGEWGPIKLNFQRIGQETAPVPPDVRQAIWRLIYRFNPSLEPFLPGQTTPAAHPNVPAKAPPREQSVGEEPSGVAVSESPDEPAPNEQKVVEIAKKPESNVPPSPPPVPPTTDDDPEDGGYTAGPAGYSSEFCGVGGIRPVSDLLGVDVLARRLAELVALRETKLPLAIGLFGHWGSGKSHFMNLMDRHMRKLAAETPEDWARHAAEPGVITRPDTSAEGPWCREIVPIYFNAWHYLDTNLWASLVSQIFESLFAHLRPKADDLAKVQRLLESASGATARAAEEVKLAQAATEQARQELQAAESSRRAQETAIDGLLQALKSLLPEVTSEKVEQTAAELLGVKQEVKTLDALRDTVREAQSLGRMQLLYNTVWKPPGRGWRLAWLLGKAAAASALMIGASYLPILRGYLHDTGRTIAGVLAGLATLLALVRPFLARANTWLHDLEGWAKQAQKAQEEARETEAVRAIRQKAIDAATKEAAARSRLAESQAREKQLEQQARDLTPERRLGRFIEDRAQSADYRGQLGLVSLARRDFQELSDLFADREALQEKVASLQATQEAEKLQEAEQITELSRSVDRIVLFVDDLDRCQPDKVVDVLQAVHLLLAYPLFAVVVGVDQRCLRQSLRIQFSGLLTPHRNGTEPKDHPARDESIERPATPLDYLEKIFHIPFHLPPMDEKGYKDLIENLTQPEPPLPKPNPVDDIPAAIEPTEVEGGIGSLTEDMPSPQVAPSASPPAEGGDDVQEMKPEPAGSAEAGQPQKSRQPPASPPPASPSSASPPPRVIGSVPLARWESDALKEYHALIRTPRAAKRLLNTYRLVRAGIPEKEWTSFLGEGATLGQYRVCMYLLALAAGHPAMVRDWFRILRKVSDDLSIVSESPAGQSTEDWQLFKNSFEAAIHPIHPKPSKDTLITWLNRVERFSF